MKGLLFLLSKLGKVFTSFKLFSGIFIIFTFGITFIGTVAREGFTQALLDMGTKIFLADYTLNQLTNKALQTPELYTFFDFLSIVSSIFIILFFIRLLMRIDFGAGRVSSFFAAILIFSLLELMALGLFIATDQIQTENVFETYKENAPFRGVLNAIIHIEYIAPQWFVNFLGLAPDKFTVDSPNISVSNTINEPITTPSAQ